MAKRSRTFDSAPVDEEERLRREIARGAGVERIKRLLEVVTSRSKPEQKSTRLVEVTLRDYRGSYVESRKLTAAQAGDFVSKFVEAQITSNGGQITFTGTHEDDTHDDGDDVERQRRVRHFVRRVLSLPEPALRFEEALQVARSFGLNPADEDDFNAAWTVR